MSKILRLQGNIDGFWNDLGVDLDREPAGPTRDRLESILKTVKGGNVPSEADREFAWNHARQIETYMPHLLVPKELEDA